MAWRVRLVYACGYGRTVVEIGVEAVSLGLTHPAVKLVLLGRRVPAEGSVARVLALLRRTRGCKGGRGLNSELQ